MAWDYPEPRSDWRGEFDITRTLLYVQRPLALGLTGVAIVMGLIVFAPTPGLEWFIPLLFLKLLVSHLLREAPYPAS